MRTTITASILIVALFLVSACTLILDPAMVQMAATECTLETVRGTYLFEAQGIFIFEDGSSLPYVEAGRWTLDGAGNAQGLFSAGLGNEIIEKEAFVATYTHDAGCVFTTLAPVGENEFVQFDLYTSPAGDFMTYFGPGFSGTHTRVDVSEATECTLETVRGTYLFEAQGNFIFDEETSLPYVEAGRWTLDGAGNAQGLFSAGLGNEIIEKEAFVATYTHDAGCVFTTLAPVGENEFVQFDLYTSPAGDFMTYFGPGFSGTHTRK